jgi:hypothetical protein
MATNFFPFSDILSIFSWKGKEQMLEELNTASLTID